VGHVGRYPAASLDRGARLVTTTVWALAAGLTILGVVVAVVASVVTGAVLIGGAASVAALALAFRPRQPVAYVTDESGLEIVRAGASARRFEGAIADVRRGKLGLRIAGDGGAYGYLGRFRADGRTVDAFVTDRAGVVLLRVGERTLAISPADPDGFVASIGGRHA